MSGLKRQEGGDHYALPIQPLEYIHANGIGYIEGNIIKYATRHRNKNGVEDIKKIIHYCELLLELEYGENKKERTREPEQEKYTESDEFTVGYHYRKGYN